ncbi:hypothetical protein ACPXB3_22490, partial [Gordonia sp. DT219]|uniref:hypothetical protein n=1 Tax=Gordonia sp. DT219 TaxID=3416658 RepID=UPI003CE83C1B
SGAADGVVRVSPREGVTNKEGITEPIIVVMEAKGPHATLGHRKGVGRNSARHYQQGRREYLESVLAAMGERGDATQLGLALTIKDAMKFGSLRYELVQARVDKNGSYSGYRHREFDIRPTVKRGIVNEKDGDSG